LIVAALRQFVRDNDLGALVRRRSRDTCHCSEANLAALEAHGIDDYVAPGRAKHPTATNGKIGGPLTQRTQKKIDDLHFVDGADS
jgi:hypothetical protein